MAALRSSLPSAASCFCVLLLLAAGGAVVGSSSQNLKLRAGSISIIICGPAICLLVTSRLHKVHVRGGPILYSGCFQSSSQKVAGLAPCTRCAAAVCHGCPTIDCLVLCVALSAPVVVCTR